MSRPLSDADAFRAIADPTRRRILDVLRAGDCTVGELREAVHRSGATMSRHLAILRNVGLVSQRRRGLHRVYTLRTGRLRSIDRWLSPYRAPSKRMTRQTTTGAA